MHSKSLCYLAAFTALILLVLALAVVSAQAQVKTASRSPPAERVACTIRWAAGSLP